MNKLNTIHFVWQRGSVGWGLGDWVGPLLGGFCEIAERLVGSLMCVGLNSRNVEAAASEVEWRLERNDAGMRSGWRVGNRWVRGIGHGVLHT